MLVLPCLLKEVQCEYYNIFGGLLPVWTKSSELTGKKWRKHWHQDMLLLPLSCRLLKRLKWHLSCRPSDSGLNFAVAWILVLDKSPMIIKRQLCSLQHFSFTVSVTHALSWKKESFINVFPVPAPSSSPRCRSGLPGGAQARPAGGDAV